MIIRPYKSCFHKLQDSFATGVKTELNRKEWYVEVFVNPSKKEYSSIPSYKDLKQVRGVLTSKGHLWVWDAELLHSIVLPEIPLRGEGDIYTIEIEGKLGGSATVSQDFVSYSSQNKKLSANNKLLDAPVIRNLFSDIDFDNPYN